MKHPVFMMGAGFLLVLALSACGGASAVPSNATEVTRAPEVMNPTRAADARPPVATSAPLAEWLSTPLTNVVTGKQFKLADFRGQTVYLEMMAVW